MTAARIVQPVIAFVLPKATIYKNAPGYSSIMGDRQQYKDAYRQAYQQGYPQGYGR